MKLIIREYLELLKESGELDKLLPDLLLSMSIPPISRAQIGVRQNGVDVAAVGKDPETKIKTLFLFVIKQGDLGRSDWDIGAQAVRPSLNEVKDVYLKSNISPKHKGLPVKIIVCTGGDLKQDCDQNWSGYTKSNAEDGKLSYDFWGGDRLAIYIEKHLFNENVLPNELRSKFRKALALLSDPDYNFSDYYEILDELLIKTEFGDINKRSTQNKILKVFRTVNLCQNIIFFWAKNEDNLRPAIYCSERTVLNCWDVIRRHHIENKKIIKSYFQIHHTLLFVYDAYAAKVQPYCYLRNGFSGSSQDYLLECLSIFENMGFLSNVGILYLNQSLIEKDEGLFEAGKAAAEMLKAYIENHKSTKSPCYDNHVIEISQAIILLDCFQEHEFIKTWISEIIVRIRYTFFGMKRYFPIDSDNFDDLIELNAAENIEAEKLFKLSTLIPILAQWCVIFEFHDVYATIQNLVTEDFPDCCLQIWYPDEKTDDFLYNSNAASESGNSESPLYLAPSIEEMQKRIRLVQDKTVPLEELSSCKIGLIMLPLLSSRHFRTPIMPAYWQSKVPLEEPETNKDKAA